MGLSRYQAHQRAASPGCRVEIYWYQDLSGERLKLAEPSARKARVFSNKGVSNWGVPHASETEAEMWTAAELRRAAEKDRILKRVLDEALNRPLAQCLHPSQLLLAQP